MPTATSSIARTVPTVARAALLVAGCLAAAAAITWGRSGRPGPEPRPEAPSSAQYRATKEGPEIPPGGRASRRAGWNEEARQEPRPPESRSSSPSGGTKPPTSSDTPEGFRLTEPQRRGKQIYLTGVSPTGGEMTAVLG